MEDEDSFEESEVDFSVNSERESIADVENLTGLNVDVSQFGKQKITFEKQPESFQQSLMKSVVENNNNYLLDEEEKVGYSKWRNKRGNQS